MNNQLPITYLSQHSRSFLKTVLLVVTMILLICCRQKSTSQESGFNRTLVSSIHKDSAYHEMISILIGQIVSSELKQNNLYFVSPVNKSPALKRLLKDSLRIKELKASYKNLIWNAIGNTDTIKFSKNLLSQSALRKFDKKSVEKKIIIAVSNVYIDVCKRKAVMFVNKGYLYENRDGLRGGSEEIVFFDKEDKWVLKESVRYAEY